MGGVVDVDGDRLLRLALGAGPAAFEQGDECARGVLGEAVDHLRGLLSAFALGYTGALRALTRSASNRSTSTSDVRKVR